MPALFYVAIPFLLTLAAQDCLAGQFRLRAREHYETIEVSDGADSSKTYTGFTNTINAWYEEPFHYSFGLAGSPLWATLHTRSPLPDYASTIRVVHVGAEGKYFPVAPAIAGFVRLGAYACTLNSNGARGRQHGRSELLGLGYEWKLGGIGLAPEMSWRLGELGDARLSGTAPAIGVHFYEAL